MSKRINVRSNSYYVDQRSFDSVSSKNDFKDILNAANECIRMIEQQGFIKKKSY